MQSYLNISPVLSPPLLLTHYLLFPPVLLSSPPFPSLPVSAAPLLAAVFRLQGLFGKTSFKMSLKKLATGSMKAPPSSSFSPCA